MTDGNLSTSTNGIALMGILDRRPGNTLQSLQHTSVTAPEYRPRLKLEVLEDRDSLQSVDSGIPTLEIGNPEPVPCSVVHVKRKQSESDIAPERAFQSACPLPSCAPPVPSGAEREQVVRKSSTFPRTGYDALRLCSPTAKALSRSDDVSLCSVSSLGTELSTTLSVSNEDILDLLVASNSSAIVTLESDDNLQFTDVTLSSTEETGEAHPPGCAADSQEGREPKLLGPLSSFFTRPTLAPPGIPEKASPVPGGRSPALARVCMRQCRCAGHLLAAPHPALSFPSLDFSGRALPVSQELWLSRNVAQGGPELLRRAPRSCVVTVGTMAVSPALLFLDRNLLARKQNARLDKQNDLGWKLFGKVPLRENAQKDSKKIQKENEDKAGRPSRPPSPKQNVRRNLDFEPLSTTALILEDRPANLPAKPADEAQKHRQQYEEMVVQAKKRELREAQRRKKQLEERCRVEESIGNAVLTWNNEILPNWDTMWCSRKVRDLWWQGIPPSVRGRVWSLAIGNELNITHELFDICLARAKERWRSFSAAGAEAENEGIAEEERLEGEGMGGVCLWQKAQEASVSRHRAQGRLFVERLEKQVPARGFPPPGSRLGGPVCSSDAGFSAADREASLELIKLDISRTFPNLCIFQQGGPYHDMLHSILGAYTCYRPDVGYVQGMSFIAAVLILNLDTADAFIAFSNLLNKPCQMAFFRVDHGLMLTYFAAFEVFFEENLPKLFAHFKKNNLTPDIYLIDWIFTLYSKSLPLDLACRIWDVFCRDGEEFLFRTALGILKLFEDILTRMDFIHIAQFLTRLPEDLPADEVFVAIATVQMQSRNKKWAQVLAALQKDSREQEKGSPALRH
ncbi:TBC1 domain family member 14 [Fukomys damarensis]|uniref:TBC1 domain family member 14 n=1 Tax=Fukomys damarensis TaxID=885580 RepID=A0A091D402_FUKDA|nr:TBC1 domain family member 14 [Fukomys damarensis]